ncbi:hypothetical protein HVC08_002387 [Salmonella enterica]|nr:hypothetical protein [Salmonella enterica]
MTHADPLSCAIKDVASAQKTTFATTLAVWRFLNNKRVTFSQLNGPPGKSPGRSPACGQAGCGQAE